MSHATSIKLPSAHITSKFSRRQIIRHKENVSPYYASRQDYPSGWDSLELYWSHDRPRTYLINPHG